MTFPQMFEEEIFFLENIWKEAKFFEMKQPIS